MRLADGGCLFVRSGHLPDAAVWWETADRALPQDGGTGFVLQGRADRIVKIAEKRISLTAMENALLASGWATAVKAVVLELPHSAARVGMVLELNDAGWLALQQQGRRQMGAALRSLLEPCVDRVALPRSWRYVARLPQNAQGKTTQHDLLELFRPLMPPPQWLQRSAHQATASLRVDAQLRVLDGHFPGAPSCQAWRNCTGLWRWACRLLASHRLFCGPRWSSSSNPSCPVTPCRSNCNGWLTKELAVCLDL